MSNLMAILLQNLSADWHRERKGLAQANREAYPRYVNLSLYVLAEIAMRPVTWRRCWNGHRYPAADGPALVYGVCITVLDTFLLLFLQRLGMRRMEVFIIGLITLSDCPSWSRSPCQARAG